MSDTAAPYTYVSSGSANQDSQVVQASTGVISNISVGNQSGAAAFLKFYNKASAPTSADTPVFVLRLPTGGGNNPHLVRPLYFSAGIAFRITTGVAFNDTGALTTNDVVVSLGFNAR